MALVKCEECGQMVSDKAEACPNCGCPIQAEAPADVSPVYVQPKEGKGVPLFVWIFIGSGLILLFIVLGKNVLKSSTQKVNGRDSSYSVVEDYNTVAKTRSLLDGSIWHFASPIGEKDMFNKWCKLVFRDGKLYYYEVSPSEGDWGEPTVCDYTIEEKRYSDTGERFISVNWHAFLMDYSFVPKTKAIYYEGKYKFVFGTFLSKGDINPWD